MGACGPETRLAGKQPAALALRLRATHPGKHAKGDEANARRPFQDRHGWLVQMFSVRSHLSGRGATPIIMRAASGTNATVLRGAPQGWATAPSPLPKRTSTPHLDTSTPHLGSRRDGGAWRGCGGHAALCPPYELQAHGCGGRAGSPPRTKVRVAGSVAL